MKTIKIKYTLMFLLLPLLAMNHLYASESLHDKAVRVLSNLSIIKGTTDFHHGYCNSKDDASKKDGTGMLYSAGSSGMASPGCLITDSGTIHIKAVNNCRHIPYGGIKCTLTGSLDGYYLGQQTLSSRSSIAFTHDDIAPNSKFMGSGMMELYGSYASPNDLFIDFNFVYGE